MNALSSFPNRKGKPPFSSQGRRFAFSIPIILGVIVLLSVILVAFITKSRMELQATYSYSNSISANELARGAAEEIIGVLSVETKAAITPSTPALSLTRIGSNSTDPRISNMIRRSVGDATVFAEHYTTAQTKPTILASLVSSTTPSLNGRKVTIERWRTPKLLMAVSGSSPEITAPDWIIVTRSGSRRVTDADLNGADSLKTVENVSGTNAALGRYAYILYDASGLVDANIVGTPNADNRCTEKGTLAAMDLTPIFGSTDPKNFLAWRDNSLQRVYGTDPTPGNPGTPGELEIGTRVTGTTNRGRFVGRQDMLKYMAAHPADFPESLARCFNAYSVTSNAPEIVECLASESNANRKIVGETVLAGKESVSIPRFRVEDASSDPYLIKKGSPFFARKFPLSRLRWLEMRDANGVPQASVQTAIKQHFGLTWVSDIGAAGKTSGTTTKEFDHVAGYVYTSPDAKDQSPVSHIKTLEEIANLGTREPDFFEWLKAAIDPNSLGVNAGPAGTTFGSDGIHNPQDESADFQIIQIGANIIDQADSDDVPTLIASLTATDRNGNALVAFGVENLPYLNEMIVSVSRSKGVAPNTSEVSAWIQPEIWAPHANAGRDRKNFTGAAIQNFRFRVIQGCSVVVPSVFFRNKNLTALVTMARDSIGKCTNHAKTFSADSDFLEFTATASGYAEPQVLTGSGGPQNTYNFGRMTQRTMTRGPAPWETGFIGISAGSSTIPDEPYPVGSTMLMTSVSPATDIEDPAIKGVTLPIGRKTYDFVNVYFDPVVKISTLHPAATPAPVTVVMEAKIADNFWLPYQTIEQIAGNFGDMPDAPVVPYNYMKIEDKYNGAYVWTQPKATDAYPFWTDHSTLPGVALLYGWNITSPKASCQKADPRTRRFGFGTTRFPSPGVSIRYTPDTWHGVLYPNDANSGSMYSNWDCPDTNTIGMQRDMTQSVITKGALPNWTFLRSGIAPLADIGRNDKNDPNCGILYADRDGVVRPGDFISIPSANFPTIPGQSQGRPYVLNRPFRSVGELGYVFRDTPWRSIDMINPRKDDRQTGSINPDLGLLNVFCIEDNELVSGKLNPFIAQREVLTAVFKGEQRKAISFAAPAINTNDVVTDDDAAIIGNAFADQMLDVNTPRSSYAKASSADVLAILNGVSQVKPSGVGSKFKVEAEAYARALSGVTNRRTWTLLLDVIAQAGRYPRNAKTLSDFAVSGERRFWVHVTLDRYTGKVLHAEYEPVYD